MMTLRCLSALLVSALFICYYSAVSGAAERAGGILTTGWNINPPYSYTVDLEGTRRWRGFDVDILREIGKRTAYSIDAVSMDWDRLVQDIEAGRKDLAAGATITPERQRFAYFSIPYRSERISLIMRKGDADALPAKNLEELIAGLTAQRLKIGRRSGTMFPSEPLNNFLNDPNNASQILTFDRPDFISLLVDKEIDGFFADQVTAARQIEANGVARLVEEHPVTIDGRLHIMFSKARVSEEVVAKFNEAITSIHRDDTYRELTAAYTFPILARLALDGGWFEIVDLIGTAAFALSGLLLAIRYNYDIFGALVLASLPAVGGGVVRDLITRRDELAVFSSSIYVFIVVLVVAVGFLVVRVAARSKSWRADEGVFSRLRLHAPRLSYAVQVTDAIGLAAFTVTGVVVALLTQSDPLWLWGPILAAITASGGGILRDVVRSDPEVPHLKGELYPEIALLWGFILSVYFMWAASQIQLGLISTGILVTFVGAFATRMATIHFGLKSLFIGINTPKQ